MLFIAYSYEHGLQIRAIRTSICGHGLQIRAIRVIMKQEIKAA